MSSTETIPQDLVDQQLSVVAETLDSEEQQALRNGLELVSDILDDPHEFILSHGGKEFRLHAGGFDLTSWLTGARGRIKKEDETKPFTAGVRSKFEETQLFTMGVEEITRVGSESSKSESHVSIALARGDRTIALVQPITEDSSHHGQIADGELPYLVETEYVYPSSKEPNLKGEPKETVIDRRDPKYNQRLAEVFIYLGGEVAWMWNNNGPLVESVPQENKRNAEEAAAVAEARANRRRQAAPRIGRMAAAA